MTITVTVKQRWDADATAPANQWHLSSGSNPCTVTAGSLLVYMITGFDSYPPDILALVTDSAGTFAYDTTARSTQPSQLNTNTAFAYQGNAAGGSHTITMPAWTAGGGDGTMILLEITGVPTSGFVRQAARHMVNNALQSWSVNGDASDGSTVTGSTPQTGDLILAGYCYENSTVWANATIPDPPSGGWTSLGAQQDATNNLPMQLSYKLASGAGNVGITWTSTDTGIVTNNAIMLVIAASGGAVDQPAEDDLYDYWSDPGVGESWDPAYYIEAPLRPNGVSVIPTIHDTGDYWSDPGIVEIESQYLDHVQRDDVIPPDTTSIQDAWDHWSADFGEDLLIDESEPVLDLLITGAPRDEWDHWADVLGDEALLDESEPVNTNGPSPDLTTEDAWPHLEDLSSVVVVPDDYQQADYSPPLAIDDPWAHWDDAIGDEAPLDESDPVVADVVVVNTPPAFEYLWEDQEVNPTIVPDSYQQVNVVAPAATITFETFWEDLEVNPTIVPDSYQQTNYVPPALELSSETGPVFDGADEDLDELIIIDFANFAVPNNELMPDTGPMFDGVYEDLDELIILDFANFAPIAVAPSAPVETGPMFDGTDEDLGELVIDEFGNFRSDITLEHQWDFDGDYVEDWRPDDGTALDSTPLSIVPYSGTLTFTGFAPNVSNNNTYIPGSGSLVFVGYPPTVENRVISPSTGVFTFVGYAPLVSSAIVPGVGTLTFVGYPPTVSQTTVLIPQPGTIAFLGGTPNISQPRSLTANTGTISFVGFAPDVRNQDTGISPATGSFVFVGYAPTITQPNSIPVIDTGTLTFVGYPPSVVQSGLIAPITGSFTFTGYPPELKQLTTPRIRHVDCDDGDRIIDIL